MFHFLLDLFGKWEKIDYYFDFRGMERKMENDTKSIFQLKLDDLLYVRIHLEPSVLVHMKASKSCVKHEHEWARY